MISVVQLKPLGSAALSAHGNKEFSPETQIKLLKAQREIQQQQIKIADIQIDSRTTAAARCSSTGGPAVEERAPEECPRASRPARRDRADVALRVHVQQ